MPHFCCQVHCCGHDAVTHFCCQRHFCQQTLSHSTFLHGCLRDTSLELPASGQLGRDSHHWPRDCCWRHLFCPPVSHHRQPVCRHHPIGSSNKPPLRTRKKHQETRQQGPLTGLSDRCGPSPSFPNPPDSFQDWAPSFSLLILLK